MRLVAAAFLLASLQASQETEKIYTNSYKGKAPPELAIDAKHWINSKNAVKLADLKGRVVWLEFSFLN